MLSRVFSGRMMVCMVHWVLASATLPGCGDTTGRVSAPPAKVMLKATEQPELPAVPLKPDQASTKAPKPKPKPKPDLEPIRPSTSVVILCEVEGKTTLLEVIPHSTAVKRGDVLAELDSAPLRERLAEQEIATEKARQAVVEAENDLAVARSALTNYTEGSVKAEEAEIARRVRVTREGEAAAKRKLETLLKNLTPQEYPVRNAQQTLDQLTVVRIQAEGTADTFKVVKSGRLRAFGINIERAQTTLKAHQATLSHEQVKRDKLKDQIARCTIKAPVDGRVMIASPTSASNAPVEPGQLMREKQVLMRIYSDAEDPGEEQ